MHDYETKKKHVVRFIDAGAKVKVTIMFRGREMVHAERGLKILEKLADEIRDIAHIENAAQARGPQHVHADRADEEGRGGADEEGRGGADEEGRGGGTGHEGSRAFRGELGAAAEPTEVK